MKYFLLLLAFITTVAGAQTKISAMPELTDPTGSYFPAIKSGVNYRVSYANLIAGFGGSGTVANVSGVNANGFSWSIANPSTTPALTLNVDGTHYLPTTTDQSNWNGKQAALGFTPENVANKATSFGTLNNTLYPTTQAVANYISGFGYLSSYTETDPVVKAITGIVKSNGTAISAAVSGTDYAPATSGTGLLKGNGSGGFSTASAGTDYVTSASTNTFTNKSGAISQWTNDAGYLTALPSLANGQFWVGNGSNIAIAVVPTGDVTFNNTGVFAIGAGKVTNTMLNGSIDNTKLLNHAITINNTSVDLGSSINVRPQSVILGSNQTTTSTTMAGATGVSVSVAASTTYRLEIDIKTSCDNTGGVKLGLSVTGSPTLNAGEICGVTNLTTNLRFSEITVLDGSNVGNYNTVASSGVERLYCEFTTTSSGTAQLFFASVTAGQTSTIRSGTTIILTPLQ